MSVSPPDRLRALLAKPGFVVMPAVWDGLSAKLSAGAGFETAFLSGSCVAASRLGGPDLDLISFARDVRLVQHGARRGAADPGAGRWRPWLRQCHERAAHGARLRPRRRRRHPDRGQDHAARPDRGRQALPAARGGPDEDPRRGGGGEGVRHPGPGAHRLPAHPGHRRGCGAHRDVCARKAPTSCSWIRPPTRARSAGRRCRRGRPSFAVLSPGAPRATPRRTQAAALGFKIGTYPTGMLSPAAAGMKAGLAALVAGEAEAASALRQRSCARPWATPTTTPRGSRLSCRADQVHFRRGDQSHLLRRMSLFWHTFPVRCAAAIGSGYRVTFVVPVRRPVRLWSSQSERPLPRSS